MRGCLAALLALAGLVLLLPGMCFLSLGRHAGPGNPGVAITGVAAFLIAAAILLAVFARDRWRCTVPACSSRRNLHDHHIRFRSRGGDNARDNRTTVCAAHHLHGIHDGTIHATGTAPHEIEWQLGVRSGAPPFLAYVGDRYRRPPEAGSAVASR